MTVLTSENLTYPKAYHACFSGFLGDFSVLRREIESLPADGSFVEFGSGSGRILKESWARKWFLLEQDPEMLEIFDQSRKNYSHQDFELIPKGVLQNNLESESMAMVFCSTNSLAEMQPLEKVLAEAHRLLAPGGRLVALNENPTLWPKLKTPSWLPVEIDGDDLEFFVETTPESDASTIDFVTKFQLRSTNSKEEHASYAIPQKMLDANRLRECAVNAGFSRVRLEGGFNREPFVEDKSLSLVLIAEK